MTFAGCVSTAKSSDRQVVRLSSAGDKNDFIRASADQSRHFTPRPVNGRAYLLSEHMYTRGIAERLGEVRKHRFDHPGVDGSGSAVVQINSTIVIHEFREACQPKPKTAASEKLSFVPGALCLVLFRSL